MTGTAQPLPARDPFALAMRPVPGLDGLRGLACLMIFNVHFFAQYADKDYFTSPGTLPFLILRILHSGSHGVDIFFVVSGYLIYGSIVRKRPSLPRFLLERYKRLLPVVLVVNIPALFWINANWKEILDNILFLDIFGSRLVTFVSWALVYEMYFYILCGIWLILLGRGKGHAPWRSFGLLCVLFVANSLYFHFSAVLADWRFAGFFVGMGLAMLRDTPRARAWLERVSPMAWLPCLAALPLGCWLWSQNVLGALSEISPALCLGYFIAFDLAVALILAAFLQAGDRDRSPFTGSALRGVGAVSYSLFMLHTQWGLPLANSLFGSPGSLAGLAGHYALSLALSFVLAAFCFIHLERPYFTRPRHASA